MQAGIYHLYIDQGATYSRIIYCTDEFDKPINLTGYTVRGHIRKSATDSVIAIDLQPIIANAAQGKITFTIPATQTALLETTGSNYADAAVYVWDIETVSNIGNVTRILNGLVYVSPEVTKS